MAADWRDERIAELEAESARKDVELAARDARIAVSGAGGDADRTCGRADEAGRGPDGEARSQLTQFALPPSSDGPGMRGPSGQGKGQPGTRKRGGERGHGGSRRTLLPPDQVDEVVDVFPSHCEGCADELPQVRDPEAHRYQQVEMPPIQPPTKEWALPRGRVPQVQAQDPCAVRRGKDPGRRPSARA